MSLESILGHDAWKTTPPAEKEHVKGCPHHEDAPEVYECGGNGGHLCSSADRAEAGCEQIEPDCTCPTPEDAAEARADARADR